MTSSDEQQTQLSREQVELLAGYATDVIYRLRYSTMRYEYISPSAEKLLGFTPTELMQMNFRSLIMETRLVNQGLQPVQSFEGLERDRKQGKTLKWQADYRIRTKDGRTLWVADVSYPWFDDAGSIIGSVGTLRDITERVHAQDAYLMHNLQYHTRDSVTGLPLRGQFFERLESELKRQKRSRGEVALMIIAITSLKTVRQSHGEEAVHSVLHHVIQHLKKRLRETDFLARVEDDVLAVTLSDTSIQGAYMVGERLRESLLTSHVVAPGGQLFTAEVNVGIAGSRFDEKRKAVELFKMAESRLIMAQHSPTGTLNLHSLASVH